MNTQPFGQTGQIIQPTSFSTLIGRRYFFVSEHFLTLIKTFKQIATNTITNTILKTRISNKNNFENIHSSELTHKKESSEFWILPLAIGLPMLHELSGFWLQTVSMCKCSSMCKQKRALRMLLYLVRKLTFRWTRVSIYS